jgi:hypothetical protein
MVSNPAMLRRVTDDIADGVGALIDRVVSPRLAGLKAIAPPCRPRAMTASEIVAEAERITFACLRARDLYDRGLSPHESPEPGVPPSVAAI